MNYKYIPALFTLLWRCITVSRSSRDNWSVGSRQSLVAKATNIKSQILDKREREIHVVCSYLKKKKKE